MAAKSCANSDQKMVDDAASLISTEVDWMLDDVTVECIAQNSVEVVHDIYPLIRNAIQIIEAHTLWGTSKNVTVKELKLTLHKSAVGSLAQR